MAAQATDGLLNDLELIQDKAFAIDISIQVAKMDISIAHAYLNYANSIATREQLSLIHALSRRLASFTELKEKSGCCIDWTTYSDADLLDLARQYASLGHLDWVTLLLRFHCYGEVFFFECGCCQYDSFRVESLLPSDLNEILSTIPENVPTNVLVPWIRTVIFPLLDTRSHTLSLFF